MRLSFQVFFVALINEYGWSRAETAGVFSVSMLVFALVSPSAGKMLDRWGSRRMFAIGAVFIALGLMGSSLTTMQWHLYFWYGVIASIGIAILGLSNYAALVSRWFQQKRGLALGIAFSGTGAGTFIIVPLTEQWISAWNWQWAMIGQGLLMLVIVLPISVFLLYYRPSDLGYQPDGHSMQTADLVAVKSPQKQWTFEAASKTWAFWLILLVGFFSLFSVRLLTVHQMAAAVDAGIDLSIAASIMGASGVIVIIAFVAWGAISDRLGRRRTYILSSVAMAGAYLTLLAVQTPGDLPWLYLYALLVGLGEGSRSSLVTAVMNDTFPGNAGGHLTGWVGLSFGVGSALGSWLAGLLFDITGSYTWALWMGVVVTILSAVCMAISNSVGTRPIYGFRSWGNI